MRLFTDPTLYGIALVALNLVQALAFAAQSRWLAALYWLLAAGLNAVMVVTLGGQR